MRGETRRPNGAADVVRERSGVDRSRGLAAVNRSHADSRLHLFAQKITIELHTGRSPSGKALDFDSSIRRFDPCPANLFLFGLGFAKIRMTTRRGCAPGPRELFLSELCFAKIQMTAWGSAP